jgi:hypothetical protein
VTLTERLHGARAPQVGVANHRNESLALVLTLILPLSLSVILP